ncbi:MAG: alpha-galactosidase [Rhodoglobus sp.]
MTQSELRVGTAGPGELVLALGDNDIFHASRLVHLEVDAQRRESFEGATAEITDHLVTVTGSIADTTLDAVWTARRIGGASVWELGVTLTNRGDVATSITRMDPLAGRLAGGRWSTLAFHSAWGDEWRPVTGTTDHHHRLDSRTGRSSHGMSPWLGLERAGVGLVVSPAWSGNWHITVDENSRVSAGISTWLFSVDLVPGESVTAPSVVIAIGESRDVAALALTTAVGVDWIPRSAASDRLDVEWNHWWPYEDVEVNEQVIWRNATVAADLGIGVGTVDAGWFGPADSSTYWGDYRGDWGIVNTARFPSGLTALGEGIRTAGLRAGIWVEAEAIGSAAAVRTAHPEMLAHAVGGRRSAPSYSEQSQSLDPGDPSFLGYVCMGSAAGRAFVLESMSATVRAMDAEWIKLDFNVDPDAGCTRTDHGHGAGDGLLRHYEGLYGVLDEFRARHPDVVLEACSSGGLRIDLGLARHVHCLFLSDPDFTEHALQVFWGASQMLPPASILHWSWSQWRGDHEPSKLDFTALTDEQFATLLRAAMLHRFGVSLRLPELSASQLEVLRAHVAIFSQTLAPMVRDGQLRRLTEQPRRGGLGERCPAMQLSLGKRHVVAQFVLEGGSAPAAVAAHADDGTQWRVTDLSTGDAVALTADGIPLDSRDGTVTSWLFLLEPR